MSFLDRVTKAVSETVDRGKKEVDQFRRIQKVKGEIGDAERAIEDARGRIQREKLGLADATLDLLSSGAVSNPALSAFADRLASIETEIGSKETLIAEKRAEIERIKAEDSPPESAADATAPPPIETGAAVPLPTAATEPPPPPTTLPPPLPAAPAPAAGAVRTCPACGNELGEKAMFCGECGTKI